MAAPGQDDKPPAYSPPVGGYGSQPPPPGQYNQQYNQQYPGYPGSYQGGAPAIYQPTPGQLPSYMQGSATTVTVTQQPSVVIVGGCPACRVGVLEDDFTCLGVCCAIFFFPLGILCCLAMRQRRCPNCGAIFS